MPGQYVVVARAAGTLITQLIYNFDHQNHIDGRSAEEMGSYGVSASQFQLTEDPYPGSVESLPPSLAGEITRLRFVLAQIISELSGGATVNWYDPVTSPGLPYLGARVVRATTFTVPNNTTTVLNFSGGTANFNSTTPAAVWDAMSNPSRFTAPIAGKYYACAWINWAVPAAAGFRLTLSMAMMPATQSGALVTNLAPTGDGQSQCVSGLFDMQANDYVEFFAFQNTGSALNLVASTYTGLNGSIPAMAGGLVFLGS